MLETLMREARHGCGTVAEGPVIDPIYLAGGRMLLPSYSCITVVIQSNQCLYIVISNNTQKNSKILQQVRISHILTYLSSLICLQCQMKINHSLQ